MDHAVLRGDLPRGIRQHREVDAHVGDVPQADLAGLLQPLHVVFHGVGGEREQRALELVELRLDDGELHELGRADRREVAGVAEEHDPASRELLGKLHRARRGLGLERRGRVPDERGLRLHLLREPRHILGNAVLLHAAR